MAPTTQYAKHGELNVAYQLVGEGDTDIVLVPSFVSHIEFFWGHPAVKSFFDRVASFSRLVLFNKTGTGMSDPVAGVPTIEQRAEEIEAVMDAVEMERATIFGLSEGGPAAIFFSVTRRERTNALVLFGSYATGAFDPQPDWLRDDERADEAQLARVRRFTEMVLTSWARARRSRGSCPTRGTRLSSGWSSGWPRAPAWRKPRCSRGGSST